MCSASCFFLALWGTGRERISFACGRFGNDAKCAKSPGLAQANAAATRSHTISQDASEPSDGAAAPFRGCARAAGVDGSISRASNVWTCHPAACSSWQLNSPMPLAAPDAVVSQTPSKYKATRCLGKSTTPLPRSKPGTEDRNGDTKLGSA